MPRKTDAEEFRFNKVYSKKDFFGDSKKSFLKKFDLWEDLSKNQERKVCIG